VADLVHRRARIGGIALSMDASTLVAAPETASMGITNVESGSFCRSRASCWLSVMIVSMWLLDDAWPFVSSAL